MDKPHVAFCFFGLIRSLKYTLPSIEKYLFDPLRSKNVKYTIYLHTYNIKGKYTNPRAGEIDIKLNVNKYKLLNPDHSMVEDKDYISEKLNLEQYRSKGNPWGNEKGANKKNFTTLDNHLLYLWSQRQLVNMVQQGSHKYTHIVFCRPDVLYKTPLNLEWFNTSNNIYIPKFGLWYNVNDRFAIGGLKEMIIYGSRFDEALAYSKKHPLNSEVFLEATLKKHAIHYSLIEFYFIRVRANGKSNPLNISQIRNLTRKAKKKGGHTRRAKKKYEGYY
jgi:hypothetical protein